MSVDATSRTCDGPPASPSVSPDDTVCTESTITSCGCTCVDLPEDRGEVGLGREVEARLQRVGALGAQAHLADRLLGAHVEHALAGCRGARATSSSSVDLPTPGLAAEQDRGARHDAAAEHAVELGDAARPVGDRLGADLGDGSRGAASLMRTAVTLRGGLRRVDDRVPLLALAAAADPLGAGPAALGAAERGRWGGPCGKPRAGLRLQSLSSASRLSTAGMNADAHTRYPRSLG